MAARVAYLINHYPKASHSFIRREILALERQGFAILRVALRGWKDELADEEDRQERLRTRYLAQTAFLMLPLAVMRTMLSAPARFASALALAVSMWRRGDRPLIYHLAYLAEASRMLPWLNQFGATHLHAHFGTNSAEVAMLAHALGGPKYSFTAHGSETVDSARLAGFDEKIGRAAFAVAVCSFGRSQLYRWVGHAQWPKIHVVHCGLESSFYDVPPVPVPSRPRLVCIGRLSEEKGQLLLVEAARRLAARGVEFELVLAGDGEMRASVDALITASRLRACVRITGWISGRQVRGELEASRGLVLPSFSEGLPVVLMEAMALRRPVLATYVGGVPELVLPGETGWLVPAGSVDDLAAAMEYFLNRPVEELTRMGEAARRRVLERHSVDVEAAKLGALFCREAREEL